MMSLPFLTLWDPVVAGEGALDPLGLAMIADRLADEMLPGLRARMSRPRFLTAMAVSAALCDGYEERYASDGVTSASLVFEWFLVEAFARAGDAKLVLGTPGIQKARDARANGDVMCARTYLKTPSVFGFHGVYKPLARHLGIVDDDLCLAGRGYELLKVWETEQGLQGFLGSANGRLGRAVWHTLRSAIGDGLKDSGATRSASWRGWALLAEHLAPLSLGLEEAKLIRSLLSQPAVASRAEVFELIFETEDMDDRTEDRIARSMLLPKASGGLTKQLNAIACYEDVCLLLEEALDWIRYLSTHAGARPINADTFSREERSVEIAKVLASKIHGAEAALESSPLVVQQLFTALGKSFECVADAGMLFEAVLTRHAQVQAAKPPAGKLCWFERSPAGDTMVRTPYKQTCRPAKERPWNRPYRIGAVRSFACDLRTQ